MKIFYQTVMIMHARKMVLNCYKVYTCLGCLGFELLVGDKENTLEQLYKSGLVCDESTGRKSLYIRRKGLMSWVITVVNNGNSQFVFVNDFLTTALVRLSGGGLVQDILGMQMPFHGTMSPTLQGARHSSQTCLSDCQH